MNAREIMWTLADELERVPMLEFDDVPSPAREWMLAWLATPREGCEHLAPGVVLYSLMGARRAMCAPCARQARLDLLVTRCGRCSASIADDDRAVSAFFAWGEGLIAALTVCHRCLNEGTDS